MRKQLLNQSVRVALASISKHPEHQHYMHWSFIVQDNQIIEWGMNRTGIPDRQWGYKPNSKIHSELSAYKKARLLLNRGPFALINIRLNRQGEWKLSSPCPTCANWLATVGCVKVYFTTPVVWATLVP